MTGHLFLTWRSLYQAGGASLEKTYRDSKKPFVQIELLAIRKEYQGKGLMPDSKRISMSILAWSTSIQEHSEIKAICMILSET